MRFPFAFLLVSTALIAPGTAALAQPPVGTPTRYLLTQGTELEIGCQDPCACPVFMRGPITGSFTRNEREPQPLFRRFDIEDVDWILSDTSPALRIVGSGSYAVGGEFALEQRLVLDLKIGENDPQHFESGRQLTTNVFPAIDASAAVHAFACYDTVLRLHAKPLGPIVGTPGESPGIRRVVPNPFAGSARIELELAREGALDLRIFDVSGREVADLGRGRRSEAGPLVLSWNGRASDGRDAPAGAYLLRLEAPGVFQVLRIVKVR